MRALSVVPGSAGSLALEPLAEADPGEGEILAETLAIGICGTDHEIVAGRYGEAAPGRQRLVIGHESLARVLEAPATSGLRRDDLVVGIVRRPDPVPCPNCAVGEWDMCRNGLYTERGIKRRDGYAAERVRIEANFAVRLDARLAAVGVLLEPASIVAKAWDEAERLGARSKAWRPASALVTGAGPVGLLAALMGVQRGLDVHVYDRIEHGIKPALVRDLGATYHAGDLGVLGHLMPDVVIECTGAAPVILVAIERAAPVGLVCLIGVSSAGHALRVDMGLLNREIVLENELVFGSVNANRRHYELAAEALRRADHAWLARLITRRVPLDDWPRAFVRGPDDVKVVLDFAA